MTKTSVPGGIFFTKDHRLNCIPKFTPLIKVLQNLMVKSQKLFLKNRSVAVMKLISLLSLGIDLFRFLDM